MKIKVSKTDDDIIIKLVVKNSEIAFDYVVLINSLYSNENIESIEFSDEVDEWEKEEITKLIEEIKTCINNPEKLEGKEELQN